MKDVPTSGVRRILFGRGGRDSIHQHFHRIYTENGLYFHPLLMTAMGQQKNYLYLFIDSGGYY